MEYLRLIIVVDENDADYLTEVTKISREDYEKNIVPVIGVLESSKESLSNNWDLAEDRDFPHWAYKGLLTEEQIYSFERFLPNSEIGIRNIEKISILPYEEEEVVFES
jgi:hypothetical protein